MAYELPIVGAFALKIFRQNNSGPKEEFKKRREKIDSITSYDSQWLPKDYILKNIGTFGKSIFLNIIMSTVEHRHNQIIQKINESDAEYSRGVEKMKTDGLDVDQAFMDILGREVTNIHLDQVISYNGAFSRGNKLFESNYFSALLIQS